MQAQEERPVLFGPDGQPANGDGAQEDNPIPKLIQLVKELRQQNQQLAQAFNVAQQELHHWRQLDATRFFVGHIVGGRCREIIGLTASERAKAVLEMFALAEAMVREESVRRPKPQEIGSDGMIQTGA